ncbi:TerC family protein [Blochmannia endosymbiont of Polyrhachis (Hedomyrma) turneri]|uniref:TerC family protein n=1 Tax=Blochmannia endosymbiont of Polyrhachis (Hedomyrma) turneri TaxID=1505596 RepID=UPI00061A69B6|nr:TerC family protein [Blochmannia endosymbiont of Polyrhachis (Hedomyrma) turneri]AKC60008.1 putative transmembrane protein [Blochmannia endosymbiont of Polyrhachis (Hedomyrma) turneri]
MEFLIDPTVWVGLFTLVILEIVLGIDNLVFIIILSNKLPEKQRDHARVLGLILALIFRLTLLSLMFWMVTLTRPLFSFGSFCFSGRDLILLFGGTFLLFKATIELHERVENRSVNGNATLGHNKFWVVVTQIVIFDAIFSLDAIITAVGMVNHLFIMMLAVIIAITIMLLTFRSLSNFVNSHQTVVVLCLSFLLMIGLSLISEGIGFHIPQGYLYTAIGFSILIEFFNQIAHANFVKNQQSMQSMRERAASAIIRLMGGHVANHVFQNENLSSDKSYNTVHFAEEERHMITGVLSLSSRTLRSIMTPRNEISWLDCKRPVEELYSKLMDTPHNMFPVCNGELDQLIGVVRAKDLMAAIANGDQVGVYASGNSAIVVPETLDVLNLLGELRRAKGSMVMVSNEFGVIQGLVTPLDVLEAIAGEFPDEDETPEIEIVEEGWRAKGSTDLHSLQQALHTQDLVSGCDNIVSLAGLLLSQCEYIPIEGDVIMINNWKFTIQKMSKYRIELVIIKHLSSNYLNEQ